MKWMLQQIPDDSPSRKQLKPGKELAVHLCPSETYKKMHGWANSSRIRKSHKCGMKETIVGPPSYRPLLRLDAFANPCAEELGVPTARCSSTSVLRRLEVLPKEVVVHVATTIEPVR